MLIIVAVILIVILIVITVMTVMIYYAWNNATFGSSLDATFGSRLNNASPGTCVPYE